MFKLSVPLKRNGVTASFEQLFSSYDEALAKIRCLIEEGYEVEWEPGTIIKIYERMEH